MHGYFIHDDAGTLVFRDTRFVKDIVPITEKLIPRDFVRTVGTEGMKVIVKQCKVAQKQKPCSVAAKNILIVAL